MSKFLNLMVTTCVTTVDCHGCGIWKSSDFKSTLEESQTQLNDKLEKDFWDIKDDKVFCSNCLERAKHES